MTTSSSAPAVHPRLWTEPDDWRDQHPWAVPIVERLRADAADTGSEIDQDWFDDRAEDRSWSDATVSLYSHALAHAGHPVTPVAKDNPDDGPRSLPLLWHLGDRPRGTVLRAAAWARLACDWPGEVDDWHGLDDRDIELEGADAFVRGRRVVGAAELWHRWRTWCNTHLPDTEPTTRAALVTCRAPDAHTPAGLRLSVRGMQDTFHRQSLRAAAIAREHATAAERRNDPDGAARHRRLADVYTRLSYDSYRRLLLRAGAQPLRPDARGAVRN